MILSPIEQRIKEKIEKIGTPLKDWDIKINYGIKTGYNEAFIIDGKKKDELIAQDPKSAEIIKPILRGKDIGRYCAKFADKWLIVVKYGAHEYLKHKYPVIYNHLLSYKQKLSQRGQCTNKNGKGQHHWLELDNNPTDDYLQQFEKEKIVYSEIVRKPQFYFDSNNFYVEATSFLLTGKNIKFLIAILNSKPFTYFFKRFYAGGGLGDEGYRYKKAFLEQVPIPKISQSQQKPFINLVNQILKITSQPNYDPNNPPAKQKQLEAEIDRLVYKLYGLSEEEVKVIDKN